MPAYSARMHGSGSACDEMRAALRRLEEALSAHEGALAAAEGVEPAALVALRRHLDVMRQEAERLRRLLRACA